MTTFFAGLNRVVIVPNNLTCMHVSAAEAYYYIDQKDACVLAVVTVVVLVNGCQIQH